METFNLYMDEVVAGLDEDGEEVVDIQFRVVPDSEDEGDPDEDAVLKHLDVFDLIELRDAVQSMIDEIALYLMDGGEDEEFETEPNGA